MDHVHGSTKIPGSDSSLFTSDLRAKARAGLARGLSSRVALPAFPAALQPEVNEDLLLVFTHVEP